MNTTPDVNIYDPAQYASAVPHDKFTRLRASSPIFFQEESNGPGYWAVMKHADISYISKNPQIFSSAKGGINIPDAEPEDLEIARLIMINMDPPQHGRFRKLVSTGFTPKMTARLEDAIRAAVTLILDRVARESEVDFVASIASQLPLYLIADLIGWPEADRDKMFDWSDRVSRIDYDPEDARIAAFEFWDYCTTLIESIEDPKNGNDDLLHTLLRAEIDGEALSPLEIVNFLLLLAIGGNETTRNCISGGFLALHQNPKELELLLQNPEAHLDNAVEEMLRWTSPIIAFRRTATEDVTLRGANIRSGDKVVLYYASGNRDEEIFQQSQHFEITRSPNPHLSFGVGQHFCLGSTLARMEIKLLFEGLLKRFPKMRPIGEVERLKSNYVNGVVSFKVLPGPDHAG
ncbi:MAG: cytochrome P450 [Myxococcota bacterium]|nr:cytochrome P450 [Myxococcota bacterium]